ncbi:hypothetical protein [Mycetocola sp.]|uniref:magnesium chelatase subunit ChlI family protein n=1 Tax=Mycetocola sp. TaxID=1871042 RepID=UPI003988F863
MRRITSAELAVSGDEQRLTSSAARQTVALARQRTAERLSGTPWTTNGQVPGPWLRSRERMLSRAVTAPLDRALERGAITMRGYDRVLRVAWTLSDLDGTGRPDARQIGRALFLRKGI